MKNRVDPHGCWEVQTIGTGPDLLEYLKRANSFVVKLLGWSFGAEISGVQPDFVANVEVRLSHRLSIEVSCMSFISRLDVELHLGVDV